MRELAFRGHGDLELRGTLVVPAGAEGVPAVLLLPGSGPTDRDGNQGPMFRTDLLKQIAERLAAEGVASLRFDKRACPTYSSTWPTGTENLSRFFGYQPFIDDVKAAYRAMRSQPGIDPARCAILGHSEGGLFALQVAADLAGTPEEPSGIALLATPGRTLDHLIREQVRLSLRAQGIEAATIEEHMDSIERGIELVRSERRIPEDMHPGFRPVFNPTAVDLLHAYFTVEPTVLAARVRGPVVVVNGDSDIQVSADLDARALHQALRARAPEARSSLVIVEGASHNLKATSGTADPGVKGPIVPKAMDAVVEWTSSLREPTAKPPA